MMRCGRSLALIGMLAAVSEGCARDALPGQLLDGATAAIDAAAGDAGDAGPAQFCRAAFSASNGMSVTSSCWVRAWEPDSLGNMSIDNDNDNISATVSIAFGGTRKSISPGIYHLGDFPEFQALAVRFERSVPFSAFLPRDGQGTMTLRLDTYLPGPNLGNESPGTHGTLDATLPGTLPGVTGTLQVLF